MVPENCISLRNRREPVALRGARRVRRAGRGNLSGAITARRHGPTLLDAERSEDRFQGTEIVPRTGACARIRPHVEPKLSQALQFLQSAIVIGTRNNRTAAEQVVTDRCQIEPPSGEGMPSRRGPGASALCSTE